MIYRIKLFFTRLKRSFKWFFFMFYNDNDYYYMFKMLQEKTKEMMKHIDKYGYHVTSKSDVRIMRMFIEHIERFNNEDDCENTLELFRKKYGEMKIHWKKIENDNYLMMNTTYSKCKTEKENKYADNLMSRIYKIQYYKTNFHLKRINRIFSNHVTRWWD